MIRAEMIWIELTAFRGMVGGAFLAFVALAFALALSFAGADTWIAPLIVFAMILTLSNFWVGFGRILEARQ